MKTNRFLFCLIACMFLLVSCKEELDMTTLQKSLFEGTSFDEITIDDAWNVTIVNGLYDPDQGENKKGVVLSYSAFLEPYIKAKKEGTAFELGFTNKLNLPYNTVMEATIFVESIKSLSLDNASTVQFRGGFLSGNTLALTLDNASVMRGGKFYAKETSIHLDNASTIVESFITGNKSHFNLDHASVFKGPLCTNNVLGIEMDNSSRLTVSERGTAYVRISMDNGCYLNMLPNSVTKVDLDLDNASEASVNVISLLKGKIRNASTLYYQFLNTILDPVLDVECDETSSCVPL